MSNSLAGVPLRHGRWVARATSWARHDVLGAFGAIVLALIVIVAIFAPWLAPFPADADTATHPTQALLDPSLLHPFGTDAVGRDILSRVMFGARTTLIIVACVLAIAAVIGVTLGMVAGYAGGRIHDAIMRVTDVFLAFPALLLSVALATVLQASLTTVIIAISVTWWPWYARLGSGMAASLRQRGFVEAARCMGQSPVSIVARQITPNAITPVLVQLSLDAGGVILTAASLSYLGLGVKEPASEWGLMIQQGQSLFLTNWWVVTFPGLAILLTAFAFNMLGESLRTRLSSDGGDA